MNEAQARAVTALLGEYYPECLCMCGISADSGKYEVSARFLSERRDKVQGGPPRLVVLFSHPYILQPLFPKEKHEWLTNL